MQLSWWQKSLKSWSNECQGLKNSRSIACARDPIDRSAYFSEAASEYRIAFPPSALVLSSCFKILQFYIPGSLLADLGIFVLGTAVLHNVLISYVLLVIMVVSTSDTSLPQIYAIFFLIVYNNLLSSSTYILFQCRLHWHTKNMISVHEKWQAPGKGCWGMSALECWTGGW